MGDVCEQCGREFERIVGHWSKSTDCDFPPLTQRQYEICVGLLMGDGWVKNKECKNQCIGVEMIAEEYLKHLDSIFEVFGSGVSLHRTSAENAERMVRRGIRPNAKARNYSSSYTWRIRSHPQITELTSWYDSGSKVWPQDIDLTPTVLKHWYCGDGCYSDKGTQRHIKISLSNEAENKEKVGSYFENVGLPRPNNWNMSKRDSGKINCAADWNVRESEELWEYMLSGGYGIPPGFEYKWPVEYRDDHTITVGDTTSPEPATV